MCGGLIMRKYVGHLMQGDFKYWSKEVVATVTANTEQEALGMLLEHYPTSKGVEWDMYGGDSEAKCGVVEELLVDGWEA